MTDTTQLTDDQRRFQLYGKAMVVSFVLIAAAVTLTLVLMDATYTKGAVGIGLFSAFWMSPLAAGVATSGLYHESTRADVVQAPLSQNTPSQNTPSQNKQHAA